MTQLKNMKFKVDSPEQSERLQKALFDLGYEWCHGKSVYQYAQEQPFLEVHEAGSMRCFDNVDGWESSVQYLEKDTAAFLAAHGPAPACTGTITIPGMETEVSFDWAPPEGIWFDNTGTMPDLPEGSSVDYKMRESDHTHTELAENLRWSLKGKLSDIGKWRYHRSEKPEEYFKQPRTASCEEARSEANDYVQPKTEPKLYELVKPAKEIAQKYAAHQAEQKSPVEEVKRTIDSHYNFSYALSEVDRQSGTIKIDPYFVAQQWKLGSKDSTGIIFHLLKTLARFGDKNSKDREINAIHKSVLRLAQLEGVELK